MEPITKEEAERLSSVSTSFADDIHSKSLQEAIEKINDSIRINWQMIKDGKYSATQPINNCIDYTRLMTDLKELYSKNGFDIYWGSASCVLMVRLTPPKIDIPIPIEEK